MQMDSRMLESVMDQARPLRRLGDDLYESLSSMIQRRQIAVGERLPPETELARQFGVSRPTVRETLARLRDEGLIASRRGSGSYVTEPSGVPTPSTGVLFRQIDSFDEIRKCYEFRQAIEGEASYLAAQRCVPTDMAVLQGAIDQLQRAIDDRSIGREADFAFHLAIARASGNSWFASALDAMRTQIETTIEIARTLSLAKPDTHLQAVQAEHVRVFDAICRQDPEAARQAMRDHLRSTQERISRGST